MVVIKQDLIPVNGYGRPGKKLKKVLGFVLHWTGNPGASDENHHDYLEHQHDRYAGAHVFVDKDSATQLVPFNEMCYHANDVQKRNKDGSAYRGVPKFGSNANEVTIGIEMCVEKDGTIHPKTIENTVSVMAQLCKQFKLESSDIYRHYDVTAKKCPAPFVDHPERFSNFKASVFHLLHPVKVAPKYPGHLIKKGSKGNDVVLIQRELNIKSDGIFGSGTEKAVIKFQKANKLVADGIVGKLTWDKLF